MVEFDLFIKEGAGYTKKHIVQPSGTGWEFIEGLRKTIDNEIENIRIDIAVLFPEGQDVNLKRPVVEDKEIQQKINKLVEIRKVNLDTKQQLTQILTYDDYIICEHCKGKMYKIPVGVSYIKYGNKYILQNINAKEIIKYIYGCENCCYSISEEGYLRKQNLLKLRKQLLDAGESFVPNEFNFWHWENDKKKTKPFDLDNEEKCNHVVRREFEKIKIPGQRQPFVKIIERCSLCGEITYSK